LLLSGTAGDFPPIFSHLSLRAWDRAKPRRFADDIPPDPRDKSVIRPHPAPLAGASMQIRLQFPHPPVPNPNIKKMR
jgi:hypothetical protein